MKTNPKSLLKYFLCLNIIFLVLYVLFFKNFLIDNIKLTQDAPDYIFYYGIFNNLAVAVILFSLCLLLALIYWNKTRSLINSIQDIKRFFIAILMIVTFAKIFLLIFVQTVPFSDAMLYVNLADNLSGTGSYINRAGDYSVYFPVGYPFILSLFFRISPDAVLIGKIFNILIFNCTLLILYSLFKSKLNKNQLVIFLLTFTFLPNNLFSSNVLMTDYLFLFVTWLIFYLILKLENSLALLILAGILTGLAAYIRPLALIFPVLFFLLFYKFDRKSSFMKFGLIAGFMLLTVLPWTIRNYNLFGSVVLISSNTGTNFLIGNHSNANGGYNFDTTAFPVGKTEIIEDKMALQQGMNDIWNNPVKSILRIPVKIVKAYYRFDSSFIWSFKKTNNQVSSFMLNIFFYFTNAIFFLILFFNVFYLFKNKIHLNTKLNYLLLLFYLYTLLIIIIFFGSDRFIIPLIPVHIYLFSKSFFKSDNYEHA